MIKLATQENCSGCSACAEICGQNAIEMRPDKWGFLYPSVLREKCVDCGLCENVCPILYPNPTKKPLASFAFMHKDERKRLSSSTAGAFVRLAEKTIAEGGLVIGCTFDTDWSAKHICVENVDGLRSLTGSKYIQSKIGDTYRKCKESLKAGRQVLFSGTPCQIAGLKRFLRKDYVNLLCVDLICHGVPSSEIWKFYLRYRIEKKEKEVGKTLFVRNVNFRDKKYGWESFSLSLSFSDDTGSTYVDMPLCWQEDPFMQSFLNHLNLRPSCFHCQFKHQRSGSDITIGDFWKYRESYPDLPNDEIGINALMVNTSRGKSFMQDIDYNGMEVTYDSIVRGNSQLLRSPFPHINRKKYLQGIGEMNFEKWVEECLSLSLTKKYISKARTFYLLYVSKHE